MRSLLIFVFSAILLASCSPEYYQAKYCPTVKDSTFTQRTDTIIIHDTILTVKERVLTVTDTVPCDDFEANGSGNGVRVKVIVRDRVLTATATCDSLQIAFRWSEVRRSIYKYREITKAIHIKKKCKWWLFMLIGASIPIAGYIAIKILKFYKKISIPFF